MSGVRPLSLVKAPGWVSSNTQAPLQIVCCPFLPRLVLVPCYPAPWKTVTLQTPLSLPCAPLLCPQAAVLLSQLTPTKHKGQFPRSLSALLSCWLSFRLIQSLSEPWSASGSWISIWSFQTSQPWTACAFALPASQSPETDCHPDRLTTNGSARLRAKFCGSVSSYRLHALPPHSLQGLTGIHNTVSTH